MTIALTGLVAMNSLFKNVSVNATMAYIVYYSALLLSLAFHISTLEGKERKRVFENAPILALLCASLFSFPFVRVFLVKPEDSWIFLSSSKILLATGVLLHTLFKRKSGIPSLLLFFLLPVLIVSIVLRANPLLLEIPSGIAFLAETFLVRKPLLMLACILFSVSSFFLGRDVYLVHMALGGVFLAWFTFNEVVEKDQERSSDSGEDLHFIVSKDLVHRLKNPLNAISVTAQLIKRKYPEVFELASNIERLCETMAEQIDRILNLPVSTVEKNVQRKDLEEELLPILQLAKIKGLEVEMSLQFEMLPIDKNVFASIVTNVFSNAVKYTEMGRVSLEVRQENDMIIVKVSDTGPGLKGEQRGFGLTIVGRLVKHLGGEMRVRVEKGTIVELRIPTGRGRDVSSDRRG